MVKALLVVTLALSSVSQAFAGEAIRHKRRVPIPELDASTAVTGLALLGGAAAVIHSRRRKRT